MHICFIANEFPLPGLSFGGIGTFLLSYSKILIENGHQVTVVGFHDCEKSISINIKGVQVEYCSQSKIKGLSWFFNAKHVSYLISEIHKKNPIDIIESQEAGFALLKIPKNIPKIIRMHGGHYFFNTFENNKLNWRKAFLERRSFANCDAVIPTSDFVKNQTLKFVNFANKPTETINNPILIDMFYKSNPEKVTKGLAVFAGTICEKKGIRQLCLAIPEIVAKFPDFHLYAYGRDWFFPDGTSYKKWLLEQLSEEIKAKITFKGIVAYKDLPEVYEQGELCIFPSHMEVQGLVAPEAMCMQKPVVFTQYGPGSETIDHQTNGWLCDTRNPKSIAQTVIEVFQSRSKLEQIGVEAREKVIRKFSPEIIYSKNINFYEKILKS